MCPTSSTRNAPSVKYMPSSSPSSSRNVDLLDGTTEFEEGRPASNSVVPSSRSTFREELGELLGMYFTDGAFRVDDVGHIASGFENWKKVGLLQTPLFHQVGQHFVRTRIGQRMMLFFVVLDKTNHQVKGGVLFRGTVLTVVHQLLDFGQHAFMLFVRGDHSRQDFCHFLTRDAPRRR